MDRIRNSAKAIIIHDGRILLICNRDRDGDYYILPGGGQNHGESLREALRRELMEEIGASVQIGDLKLVRDYIGTNHEFAAYDGEAHQVELMFECQVDPSYTPASGKTPDVTQTGVVWVALSELAGHRLYPKVLSHILKNGISGLGCAYLGDVN